MYVFREIYAILLTQFSKNIIVTSKNSIILHSVITLITESFIVNDPCDPNPCNKGNATGETCDAGICNCGNAPCPVGDTCDNGVCGMY